MPSAAPGAFVGISAARLKALSVSTFVIRYSWFETSATVTSFTPSPMTMWLSFVNSVGSTTKSVESV